MAARRNAAAGEAVEVGTEAQFEANVQAAIARCTTLSPEDARHFLDKGCESLSARRSARLRPASDRALRCAGQTWS